MLLDHPLDFSTVHTVFDYNHRFMIIESKTLKNHSKYVCTVVSIVRDITQLNLVNRMACSVESSTRVQRLSR
jgi:hypothetical protein